MSGAATAARSIAHTDTRPEADVKPRAAAAPVRGSLVAAVAELARVAASSERLQNALSPLLLRGGEPAEAAQALDEITQHLRGLEGFLAAIAADCPPDWRLDLHEAASVLRLHSQKLRLTCADGALTVFDHLLPQPDASGELELW